MQVMGTKKSDHRPPTLRVGRFGLDVVVTLSEDHQTQDIRLRPTDGSQIDLLIQQVDQLLSGIDQTNNTPKGNGADPAAILRNLIPPGQPSVTLPKAAVKDALEAAGIPASEAVYNLLKKTFESRMGRHGGLVITRNGELPDDDDLPADADDGLQQELGRLVALHTSITDMLPKSVSLRVTAGGRIELTLPPNARLAIDGKRLIVDVP